jgi:hypothetical protein
MTAGPPGAAPPPSPRAKIEARQRRQNVVVRAQRGGCGRHAVIAPTGLKVTLKAIKFAQRLLKPPAIEQRSVRSPVGTEEPASTGLLPDKL